jgi:hypothetical protein
MDKKTIKILFDTDSSGYITGWQQEFWDGVDWQTPFDTTNAVELAMSDLDAIVIGATKLVDGQLVLDTVKQAELEAEADKVIPTAEQQLISTLMLKVAKLEAGA